MANSTQEAIRIAAEGIAKLKTEMTSLNTIISTGAKDLHSMLSADATSFKELSKLIKQVEENTKKLNDASKKSLVVGGKVKTQQNQLAKTYQSLNAQKQKQISQDKKITDLNKKQTNSAIKGLKNLFSERQKGIKQREAQVEKVSKLDQSLRKLKSAEDKVSSKARIGRMIESANAIGKTNDELKKMSQFYQALEKNQIKQANLIAKENSERIKQANSIASNKKALQSQKNKEINDIKKLNQARLSEADAIERNKKALQDQKNKVVELLRPYNKLIAQHKLSKNVLQDLIISQGKNSTQTKKAQIEYDKLTKKINQANGATKNFAKGGLRSSVMGIKNLLGAFGIIGGVQLFAGAIRNVFNRVREFDKTMQNLAGVFRTTRADLKPLEDTIIDVAGSSVKTSREVASLAETLATLGKTPEQIQKLLSPVVDLGIGLQATGAQAGEFLIQMLNAFGASDDQALNFAETIATIRTSTSLDFQKMRDSFQYMAPISRLLGKDLAYTGAVVGILADNGLKAQQAGRVLGTSLQKLAIKGLTLTDALEKINTAQKKGLKGTELLAMANSLLGAEGAKIGIVLARNTDLIEKNAEAYRKSTNALKDLVGRQLESLDAKLKILDSSFEKLIFSIENGNGAISGFFKNSANIATGFLNVLTDINDTSDGFFDFLLKSSQSLTSIGRMQMRTESAIKKETEKRISIIDKILKIEEGLGVIEHERNNNKSEYIKLSSIELAKMLQNKKLSKESFNETEEKIEKELEGRDKINKHLKGSLAFHRKEISLAEESIEQTTLSTKEYEKQLKVIKNNEDAIDSLIRKLVQIPDKGGVVASSLPKTFGVNDVSDFSNLNTLGKDDVKIKINTDDIDALVAKLVELEELKDIFAEVTDTFSDMFDIDVSKFDFLFDNIGNTVEDWAKLSKELIGSVLDASLQSYQIELQQAQIARDTTLNNDLSSEEQKEASRAKFREKERDINTRKAKEERKNNLIKIAVDTAVGVVSAFGNPLKIAAIIALGLSQAAIVASQPLPQFEKGTQNSPKGMAITDEKGAEIHTDKKGNIKDLGSNKGARKKFLEKGDKIFTAQQSKGMLNSFSSENLQQSIFDMNMFGNGKVLSEKVVDTALLNKMDALASSNEMVWREVKKLASRPINVNNRVEIKQDRAY